MDEIDEIIDHTPLISDVRKTFLKHIIHARFSKILLDSYELLMREMQ